MRLLFDGELDPITSTIGFLEMDCGDAVEAFTSWMGPLQAKHGVELIVRETRAPLRDVMLELLPLTSVDCRRYLFIPTASRWTAYLDNGHRGTDAFAPVSYLAVTHQCHGARVVAVPDSSAALKTKSGKGRYGAVIFELYGPKPNPILNYVRTIAAINDGGKWVFDQSGEPLAWERTELYNKRRIRDRFTFDALVEVTAGLGLRPFDEDFYQPQQGAFLVSKEGPVFPNVKSFTLEQVRADRGL
jgi:hypothetical protein